MRNSDAVDDAVIHACRRAERIGAGVCKTTQGDIRGDGNQRCYQILDDKDLLINGTVPAGVGNRVAVLDGA